eukprot:14864278-Alexandrium_andersonii.AAC.1
MLTTAAIDKIHSLTAIAKSARLAGEAFKAAEDRSSMVWQLEPRLTYEGELGRANARCKTLDYI